MITEYHRPETLEDLFTLLTRDQPRTLVLGGGLFINEVIKEPIAVVDIQALGLDGIKKAGKVLQIGAGEKLAAVLAAEDTPPAVKKAIAHQETNNRRQVATLAGTLVAAGGRSAAAGAFLALDAQLEITGPDMKVEHVQLGEFIPLREEKNQGKLISRIMIPTDVDLAYHYVARSPADLPIVGACTAVWPSGRTRVVLIGYGDQPIMVFDGPDSNGAEIAARDAFADADDQWASGDYRSDIAGILVKRSLDEIADR